MCHVMCTWKRQQALRNAMYIAYQEVPDYVYKGIDFENKGTYKMEGPVGVYEVNYKYIQIKSSIYPGGKQQVEMNYRGKLIEKSFN